MCIINDTKIQSKSRLHKFLLQCSIEMETADCLVLNFFRFFFLLCKLLRTTYSSIRCQMYFFSIFELHCKYLYFAFWAIVRSSVLYEKNILKNDPLN